MYAPALKAAAVGGVAALALTAAAPGYAATVVGRSSAAAIDLSIAGNGYDSGRVTATVDSAGKQNVQGNVNPALDVLKGQDLLNAGVLAQEAEAMLRGGVGVSEACSGVAGDGGSVIQLGESGCLDPGEPINLSFQDIDLTQIRLADPESPLAPLDDVLDALRGQEAVQALNDALSEALANIPVRIGGTFGAIQAFCDARPGKASGTALITDSRITATVGEQSVVLLDFPVRPAPNTKIVSDMDEVIKLIGDALRTNLEESLNGALAQAGEIGQQVANQIADSVVAQISDQLQAAEAIIDGTLNKQTRTGADQIDVTAIDLSVLPAAADTPLGASAVDLAVANVTCGPNGQSVSAPPPPQEPKDPGKKLPPVPTAVTSGTDGTGGGAALLGGLIIAAAGALSLGGRRRQRS